MNRIASRFILPALVLVLGAASAAAQTTPPTTATAVSEAPFREGTVWELTFIRVVPGMFDDYLKSLSATWKKIQEEAKKQGFVLSYRILSAPSATADDWDLLLMVEYKNFATLDGIDAKFRAIEAKTVGPPEQVRTLMTKRLEVRQILGDKIAQELFLK
jgi:hypothetical protein